MNRDIRYEIGPIRPPSEATSLLLRFTRNCPWNRCEFCHLYKKAKFQIRSVSEIKNDIDAVKTIYDEIISESWRHGFAGKITDELLEIIYADYTLNECYKNVALWAYFGAQNVFIQDANSLVMRVDDLCSVLVYLKERFPSISRITSYARSQTVANRLKVEDLKRLNEAGLTRLHLGLESGDDTILKFMKKGVTPEEHVQAGKKILESGIELSEYVILGLGGKVWWKEHAEKTAAILNRINPHFIRFRTLKVVEGMPLYEKIRNGEFTLQDEEDILREERLLLEKLEDIESYVKSDHILNLLEEVEGKLPDDREKMISVIDRYFSMTKEERLVFRLGRRMGIYRKLEDLQDELTYYRLKKTIREIEEREPGGVEKTLSLLLERYI
ncbi:MAG: radical SAM protein [Deltaproteobacteria bacterium]|nr:radical SAM protein [Deltaproteobacteria bacterium]